MSGVEFDFSELGKFEKDLLDAAESFENGKHAKAFLRSSAGKLRTRTLRAAKSSVNKKTGNLYKGIKKGKAYRYRLDGKTHAIRVYGGSPAFHAHLLNNGHRIVDKHGNEHGWAKGHHFFEAGKNQYEGQYYGEVQKFVDELLNKHGIA